MLPLFIRIGIGLLLMIHGFAHWNITSLGSLLFLYNGKEETARGKVW